MKKFYAFLAIVFFGCAGNQINYDNQSAIMSFNGYELIFHGKTQLEIKKIGGGNVFFDDAFFGIDGNTVRLETMAHYGYSAKYNIDGSFLRSIASAGFVSWRPSNYTNDTFIFSGEQLRRMEEYYNFTQ
jgi:hypothetical protein